MEVGRSGLFFLGNIHFKLVNNEILYNILLEKHDKMIVNNLIVETLNPKNLVAKSYLGQMTVEEKTILLNSNYEHLYKLDEIKNLKIRNNMLHNDKNISTSYS